MNQKAKRLIKKYNLIKKYFIIKNFSQIFKKKEIGAGNFLTSKSKKKSNGQEVFEFV